jgi:AraC-like DNA-binding protein
MTAAILTTSTGAFPRSERFQYWADVVTQTFVPLECDARDRANFRGAIRYRRIGLVGIADVRAAAMQARRTAPMIARAPSDDLIVVLHVDGICRAGQRAASAELRGGDGAMVVTDESYFFEFPDRFRQIVLKLPRALLPQERIGRNGRRALALAAGSARLLRNLALSSLDDPMEFSVEEETGIEQAFADLVSSAMVKPPETETAAGESSTYHAACQLIRQRLFEADLNPRSLATHLHMSARTLARLFARHGTTVERTIWNERLEAARRDLADPRMRDRSITDIAFSCGFNDAAHFSRSFARAYAMAPGEFRAAQRRLRAL